jgi:hypothetical protein
MTSLPCERSFEGETPTDVETCAFDRRRAVSSGPLSLKMNHSEIAKVERDGRNIATAIN